MTKIIGPPEKAIRNKPITAELTEVLKKAGEAAGVDTIDIVSGGQDAKGKGKRRTGSTRHDLGRAADVKFIVGGKALTFTDTKADPKVLAFVTAAAAAGAIGIGAGVEYMGHETIHVGFGTSKADKKKRTGGKSGRRVNAPRGLREAARAGWNAAGGSAPKPKAPAVAA